MVLVRLVDVQKRAGVWSGGLVGPSLFGGFGGGIQDLETERFVELHLRRARNLVVERKGGREEGMRREGVLKSEVARGKGEGICM